MSRIETIGKFDASLHPGNVPAHIVTARTQGLRDIAGARQQAARLKALRPHAAEDTGRALFELRAAHAAAIDEIDAF